MNGSSVTFSGRGVSSGENVGRGTRLPCGTMLGLFGSSGSLGSLGLPVGKGGIVSNTSPKMLRRIQRPASSKKNVVSLTIIMIPASISTTAIDVTMAL